MALEPPSAPDVISPAEAQFWQEQAQRVPQILRAEMAMMDTKLTRSLWVGKVVGLGMGATLAAASFTKYVPGRWKWLTGSGAVAAVTAGWSSAVMEGQMKKNQGVYLAYADALEKNPALSGQLADYLSSHVTAADIQQKGLEGAVVGYALEFGMTTPYLQGHAPTVSALSSSSQGQGCGC